MARFVMTVNPEEDRELAVQAVRKIERDLQWRGPNPGSMHGHVVLRRELAEALLRFVPEGFTDRLPQPKETK